MFLETKICLKLVATLNVSLGKLCEVLGFLRNRRHFTDVKLRKIVPPLRKSSAYVPARGYHLKKIKSNIQNTLEQT
jgi:hypothetical protein